MKKKYFIYIWTNLINGRKYIGSHCGDEFDGYLGSGIAFRHAIKMYGIENFSREIIEYSKKETLLEREQFWLDYYGAATNPLFYNISGSAGGGRTLEGKTPDEIEMWKTNLRASQLSRNYTPTQEARKKMSEASLKFFSEEKRKEWAEKYSGSKNPMYGKQRSHNDETKSKMSQAHKIRLQDPKERAKAGSHGKNHPNSRPIIINDIYYENVQLAHKDTGLPKIILNAITRRAINTPNIGAKITIDNIVYKNILDAHQKTKLSKLKLGRLWKEQNGITE